MYRLFPLPFDLVDYRDSNTGDFEKLLDEVVGDIAAARKNHRHWGQFSKFHSPETVKIVQTLLREGSLSKADIA